MPDETFTLIKEDVGSLTVVIQPDGTLCCTPSWEVLVPAGSVWWWGKRWRTVHGPSVILPPTGFDELFDLIEE